MKVYSFKKTLYTPDNWKIVVGIVQDLERRGIAIQVDINNYGCKLRCKSLLYIKCINALKRTSI